MEKDIVLGKFDEGKRVHNKLLGSPSQGIYMNLLNIIRNHALVFLPAKSLFRFKSVSKDWSHKISTPFFSHSQTNSFHAISGFFSHHSSGTASSFISLDPSSYGVPDPSLSFLVEKVDVKASSNGLLCCQGRIGKNPYYYITNPATKQWKQLPSPNAAHGTNSFVALVFEPSLYEFVAEYKVVCAFYSSDFEGAYEFEIYSSTTESWSVSGEIFFFGERRFEANSGVHANGIVYFKMVFGGIFAFDLEKERSHLIDSYGVKGCLGVAEKKLCKCHVSGKTLRLNVLSNIYSNTMEMNQRARTWEERLQVQIEAPSDVHVHGNYYSVVLLAGDLVVIRAGKIFFSYNLKTKESLVLGIANENGRAFFPYVNNLVSF